MQPWYWFSGLIGVGVVTCLVQGIRLLGPTLAVSIALTSQLSFALLWDSLGWMGLTQVPFTWKQLSGVLVVIVGMLVFKWGGQKRARNGRKRRESVDRPWLFRLSGLFTKVYVFLSKRRY